MKLKKLLSMAIVAIGLSSLSAAASPYASRIEAEFDTLSPGEAKILGSGYKAAHAAVVPAAGHHAALGHRAGTPTDTDLLLQAIGQPNNAAYIAEFKVKLKAAMRTWIENLSNTGGGVNLGNDILAVGANADNGGPLGPLAGGAHVPGGVTGNNLVAVVDHLVDTATAQAAVTGVAVPTDASIKALALTKTQIADQVVALFDVWWDNRNIGGGGAGVLLDGAVVVGGGGYTGKPAGNTRADLKAALARVVQSVSW